MTLPNSLVLAFTLFASIGVVTIVILLGWFLIWKAFLSKFRLVRELLGQPVDDKSNNQQPHQERSTKTKKIRKD